MGGSADGRRTVEARGACVIDTDPAYCRTCGAKPDSNQGAIMADKSPRQHMSKKAGKSLKEKRVEKQAKAAGKNKIEIVPPGKKH